MDPIEQLAEQRDKPTLEQVVALAKQFGIVDADRLWRLYDRVLMLWADYKDYSHNL